MREPHITPEDLYMPLAEEDVLDQEDYMESCYATQFAYFRRLQAQGAHPELVREMWEITCLLDQAAERLAALRKQGCFAPNDLLPVRNGG